MRVAAKTRRTVRRNKPGSSASSQRWLARFGIMSTLPASLGTQKLWITSTRAQIDAHRASGRDDEFVAGDEGPDASDRFLRILELEPPLIASGRDLISIGPLILRTS